MTPRSLDIESMLAKLRLMRRLLDTLVDLGDSTQYGPYIEQVAG
jgi:hypothetical protein